MIEILLQAERALTTGLIDQAERMYRQAADADPRNSIAVVGLARVALERGDEPAAWRFAQAALAIDGENVAAQRLAGRLEEVWAYRGTSLPEVALAEAAAADAAAVDERVADDRTIAVDADVAAGSGSVAAPELGAHQPGVAVPARERAPAPEAAAPAPEREPEPEPTPPSSVPSPAPAVLRAPAPEAQPSPAPRRGVVDRLFRRNRP